MGTEGSHLDDPNKTSDKVFDGNSLTYYRAKDEVEGTWAGLEFDSPHRITDIRYVFRNDDNNIRPGDTYELVYWADGGWKSLGSQTADSNELYFNNAPTGALFFYITEHEVRKNVRLRMKMASKCFIEQQRIRS